MSETKIASALFSKTETILAGLGFGVATIDWGLPFTPPANLGGDTGQTPRTIEVRHFRNATTGPFWAGGTTFQGIWQISVIDYTQKGEIAALAVCTQIADAFAKDSEIWHDGITVKFPAPPSILSVIEEQHRALYPVSIAYRTEL